MCNFDSQMSTAKCQCQIFQVNQFKTDDTFLNSSKSLSGSNTDDEECLNEPYKLKKHYFNFSTSTSSNSSQISLNSSESLKENAGELQHAPNGNLLVLCAPHQHHIGYGSMHSTLKNIQRDTHKTILTDPTKSPAPVDEEQRDSSSKMPKGESAQRRPLLSKMDKNVYQKKPEGVSNENAKTEAKSNNEAMIINMPSSSNTEEGDEESDIKYPNEIGKLMLVVFMMCVSFILTLTSLAVIHELVPDRSFYHPLPDIILSHVIAQDWALQASEYIIMLLVTSTFIVLCFHRYRFIVFRRIFFILSILYFMRAMTMFVTVLPVASRTYYCSPKVHNKTFFVVLKRVFYMFSGFGLSINGKHVYCGDYIFSGHTVILIMCYLLITEYTPKRFFPVHWLYAAGAFLGVLMVLLSHGHYTIDILIAYYATTRMFWTYHTLANNDHLKKRSTFNYLAKNWWFFIFQYLEQNIQGPLPCQFVWPFPWPQKWRR